MTDTTIPVSSEIRDPLREKKGFHRTWDEFFAELLENDEVPDRTERNELPEPRSQ